MYTVQLCLFSVQQPEVPVFTSVADPDPTNNIDVIRIRILLN